MMLSLYIKIANNKIYNRINSLHLLLADEDYFIFMKNIKIALQMNF